MQKTLKLFTRIFLLLLLFGQFVFAQTDIPQQGFDAIQADELRAHVAFLASDELRGRDTPSPELDSSAAFIANYFKECGLTEVPNADGYYQYFPLLKTRLAGEQKLKLQINGTATEYEVKGDFVPLHLTANREITAPVVFVGYGITANEYDYNDYSKIDVKGKIVLAFTHEPQEKDSTSVFDGSKMTDYSKLDNKVMNAIDHGAVGFIYVTDPLHRFRRPPNMWPSLMRHAPEDAIPLILGEKEENKIVVVRIGKSLADDLMSTSGKTMEAVHQEIDETLTPQSFELPGIVATISTQLEGDKTMTQNVVGFWEGADPELKKEIVVIGGHYDHLGATSDTVIYNGADDNASGTAGVMGVAKAFTSCPERPKRSILFMAFAGEEKGLFGSRYYASTEPLLPIENTIAMLNLDMISRNDTSAVEVYGSKRSPDLANIFLDVNKTVNMKYDFKDDRRMSGGSDHMSFHREKVPYLFFITGLHEDYHKPTDTVEKILPEKMATVTKMTFGCAWKIANMEGRPALVEVE